MEQALKSLSVESVEPPRAHFVLAVIYEEQQKWVEAADHFDKFLKFNFRDKNMVKDATSKLQQCKMKAEKLNEHYSKTKDDIVTPSSTSKPILSATLSTSPKQQQQYKYDIFLSHYQKTGGHWAMSLKLLLEKADPTIRVFLDVDDLEDIHDLVANVEKSMNIAILVTEGVFERQFVQLELKTALQLNKSILQFKLYILHDIDIIPIWDKNNCAFPNNVIDELKSIVIIVID
jgi:hypothetical protein